MDSETKALPGFTCSECRTAIMPDQVYWAVNFNQESYETGAVTAITTHDTEPVRLFCEACAPTRDEVEGALWNFLKPLQPFRTPKGET